MGSAWEVTPDVGTQVPRFLCILTWPSNFYSFPLKIFWSVDTAFGLRVDLRPSEFIIEVDLKACGLNLGKGPQVVIKGAEPFTEAVFLAISSPPEVSTGPRGGCYHSLSDSLCLFIYLLANQFSYCNGL